MKKIFMHNPGTRLPKRVAALKDGDVPLIAIVNTKHFMEYFFKFGFEDVKDCSGSLPPLGVTTNLSFRSVLNCRLVATTDTMLHSTKSKFSRRFRTSSDDRVTMSMGLNPEKMWFVFRNLGISYEAFGTQRDWVQRFSVGFQHPKGFWIHQGLKNMDELTSIIRPYVQEAEPLETN
jgi:hypothetical protein